MHPINSQEHALKRTKIALALPSYISTAFERHSSRLVPVSVRKDLKGCSVPTLATLTACREVGVFYKRSIAKSSETTPQEMPMASAVSAFRTRRDVAKSQEAASRHERPSRRFPALFYPDIIRKVPSPGFTAGSLPQAKPFLPFPGANGGFGSGFSMKYTDIAIIGGGLAGSTAAAMLGTRRDCNGPDRPARDLSVRLSRRKIKRRRAARSFFQDRHRRFGAAPGHP